MFYKYISLGVGKRTYIKTQQTLLCYYSVVVVRWQWQRGERRLSKFIRDRNVRNIIHYVIQYNLCMDI